MFADRHAGAVLGGVAVLQGHLAGGAHGATNMNTLIAVGTSAAYLYSVFVTFFPDVGTRRGLVPEVYYDTSP